MVLCFMWDNYKPRSGSTAGIMVLAIDRLAACAGFSLLNTCLLMILFFVFESVHSAHLSESQGTHDIKNANPLKRNHSPQNASSFSVCLFGCFFFGNRIKEHSHWLRIMPRVSAGIAR